MRGTLRHVTLALVFVAVAVAPATADSLWGARSEALGSIYVPTAQALGLGDIITIQIVENTRATNTADLTTDKQTTKGLEFQDFARIGVPLGIADISEVFGVPLSTDPSFSVDATSEFAGEGESGRTTRITSTISAQVVEVLANGALKIEATQTVHINEERNTLVLTGIIRPLDVSTDNTIMSTRIANAEIFYTGRGPLTNTTKRGLFTELWEFIWPF